MKAPIYITSNNTYIRKSGNHLIIDREGHKIPVPAETVSYIVLIGNSQISNQVLNYLCEMKISVMRFSYGGKYTGMFLPPEHNIGKSRLMQYSAYFDMNKRLKLATEFVRSGAYNKITVLKRHYYKNKTKILKCSIDTIKENIVKLDKVESIDILRGIEGFITKTYYDGLRTLFKQYSFEIREYHPPKDEINCLLSYGYSLVNAEVCHKIQEHGLCVFLGYLHETENGKLSLVYDISEVFRQWVDLFVLSLVNNREITDSHFNKKEGICMLNTYGKMIFLKKWEAIMRKTLEINDSLKSRMEIVRLECIKVKQAIEENVKYEGFRI